jgi:hypothetical protein
LSHCLLSHHTTYYIIIYMHTLEQLQQQQYNG